jgi:electron transport complex protein RnfD
MEFTTPTGPHWHNGSSVSAMMRTVVLALLPVIACSAWFFGAGILLNVIVAMTLCIAFEWIALTARGRSTQLFITDGSAIVTGILLALALPPLIPWWVLATACLFAIIVAKHFYGGIGFNVFNPAMVGYVVVLIAFPQHLAVWPAVGEAGSLATVLNYFLTGAAPLGLAPDVITAATPLDAVKIELGQMQTMSEIFNLPGFGALAGDGWIWINMSALAGGGWLLWKRVIRWHIPGAMLIAIAGLALLFYALDSATHPTPFFELLSGGTMLGAFFIATDPVSAASSDRGRIIYGAGIGILCFALRRWGSHPDGLAFAVLLMNMAVPLIDRFTVPRIYGHRE